MIQVQQSQHLISKQNKMELFKLLIHIWIRNSMPSKIPKSILLHKDITLGNKEKLTNWIWMWENNLYGP